MFSPAVDFGSVHSTDTDDVVCVVMVCVYQVQQCQKVFKHLSVTVG